MAAETEHVFAPRSHDVEEIIGTPASWAARYGTILLFVVVVALVAVSWFVTYPTYVEGRLSLTSVNPPRLLRAQQDFLVADVLVGNRDTVEAGQTLLVANRSARFEHVAYLEDELIEARAPSDTALLRLNLPTNLVLGELEAAVAEFRRKQEDFRNTAANPLRGLTSVELRRLIRRKGAFIETEERNRRQLADRLILERRQLREEEELAEQGLSNERQLATARMTAERTEERLQQSRTLIANADYEREIAQNRLDNFSNFRPEDAETVRQELYTAFERLRAAVSSWKRDYTVVSPVRGVVLLAPDVRAEELVFREANLATVVPVEAGDVIGRMNLPLRGSGKVAAGQRVLVRFDRYPYLEFGSVEGVVIEKSTVPYDDQITVQVAFPNQLRTSSQEVLDASPLMQGSAYIETDNARLLTRFIDYL